jgi:hypothetical protein
VLISKLGDVAQHVKPVVQVATAAFGGASVTMISFTILLQARLAHVHHKHRSTIPDVVEENRNPW